MTDSKATFVEIIVEMSEAGSSDERITRTLNRKGYRTPTKGVLWTRKSVYKHRAKHMKNEGFLFQYGKRPTQVEDFFPFVVPLGTDFYCFEPGPRRYGRKANQ